MKRAVLSKPGRYKLQVIFTVSKDSAWAKAKGAWIGQVSSNVIEIVVKAPK